MPFRMGDQGGEAAAEGQEKVLPHQIRVGLARGLDQQQPGIAEQAGMVKNRREVLVQVIFHPRPQIQGDARPVEFPLQAPDPDSTWSGVVG